MSSRPRGKTFDVELELQDTVTLTSSDAGQVDSVDKIIDLHTGGVVGFNLEGDIAVAETPMEMVVDVSAITINDNDELYHFILEGSSNEDFSSDVVQLGVLILGANEVLLGSTDADSAVGRHMIPVSNLLQQTAYRYTRLNTIVSGTSPSITFAAFLGKRTH